MTGAHIYLAYARLGQLMPPPLASPLPEQVSERLSAMHSASARAHSQAGYWLLERAGALAGQQGMRLDRLAFDANGRPIFPSGPDFNISHSRGLVACALGIFCRVGLDVERIRPIRLTRLRRFLNPRETAASDADPAAFFRAWAAREASVKAGGRVGLARIARTRIDHDTSSVDGETWHLRFPALAPDYAACLACDQPGAHIDIQDFSASLIKNKPA